MQNKQMKQMVNGAVILSGAALLTKVLSAVYKVPFQNLTGDEGFYVYQQVYPLYGIAAALSLNGLPVFVSKITAELSAEAERKAVIEKVFHLLLIMGSALWLAFWFGASFVAGWMGDPELAPLIRSVSFVYLLMPFLAVSRGYFQGRLDMLPTGISQVGEQVVRVGIILFAAIWFTKSNWTVYEMGTIAMSASWIAGIAAVLILTVFLKKETNQQKPPQLAVPASKFSYQKLMLRLATEGMVISAFSSLLVFLQLIDSFTVYKGLLDSGMKADLAMAAKGVYDRGQPLVQLGMVVGTGFASSLLPVLSQQRAGKQESNFVRTASSVVRITAVFASAATIGLILLMPQFNHTLFSDTAGTAVLQVYVLGVFVASLIGAYNAILQSLNRQKTTFFALAAGLAFKAAFNQDAVAAFGTIGASSTTVGALFVVLFLLWVRVPRSVKQAGFSASFIGKLFLALLGMGGGVKGSIWLVENLVSVENRIGALLLALLGVAAGAVIFILILFMTRALTIREWLSLPFGRKLLKRRLE